MKNNKQLVILGAGGHAKVCFDVARAMNNWNEILILDDNPSNDYFEIAGSFDLIEEYPDADFFVAVGSNSFRNKLLDKLEKRGFKIAILIHPSAVIGENVSIDVGSVLMANVVINSGTVIGKGGIINTAASVDHDNELGMCVHLSPGVHTAGTIKIGDFTWLGVGSVVSNNISITNGVVVGAGATVVNNLTESGTYIGTPAKLNNI